MEVQILSWAQIKQQRRECFAVVLSVVPKAGFEHYMFGTGLRIVLVRRRTARDKLVLSNPTRELRSLSSCCAEGGI